MCYAHGFQPLTLRNRLSGEDLGRRGVNRARLKALGVVSFIFFLYLYLRMTVILIFLGIFLSSSLIGEVSALECYVCTRQEGNTEKCLTTTKTCESYENSCQTELRWGSTPYWSQGAEKQYYVTKRCARKEVCEQSVGRFTNYCHRIWYEDWKCAECCQGDRCNYYIIMGASNLRISWLLLFLTSTATTFFIRHLRM